MSHLDQITQQVNDTLNRHSISEMNTLLIALSKDSLLSRDDRYIQQQRLRNAIVQKGNAQLNKEQEETRR